MTPTYTKPVFRRENGLEETHRLDHRNLQPTPVDLEQKIIDAIWEIIPHLDALIALDQLTHEGCGVLTPRVRRELAKVGNQYPDLVLYAASRAFIKHFHNMIIKCNNIEAVKLFYTGRETTTAFDDRDGKEPDVEEVKKCFLSLADQTGRPVFISCGSGGIMVKGRDGLPVLVPGVSLPPDTRIDIVGAGDACSSGIVTALCAGASPEEAAFVGNLVAAYTIQIIGTTGTATRNQVLALYDKYFGNDV
jgi:sugar/nucleoside kinase (ribokinase family)